jgi:hypothetical protein
MLEKERVDGVSPRHLDESTWNKRSEEAFKRTARMKNKVSDNQIMGARLEQRDPVLTLVNAPLVIQLSFPCFSSFFPSLGAYRLLTA